MTGTISFLISGHLLTSKYKFKKNKESYLAKINCSAVLGLLEHHSSKSKTTDFLMLAIKASTVDEHSSLDSPILYGKVKRPLLVLLLKCWQSICFLIVGLITHPSHHPLLMPVMFLMRSIMIWHTTGI
jgi:hypothetical protein